MTTSEIRPILTPPAAPTAANPSENGGFQAFGEDGFTFGDFIDIINPLQHIPVVATIYRAMTGDDIDPGARVAGGALFGGPVGLVAAGFNAVIDESTGKDLGQHVLAFFAGDDATPETPLSVASTPGDGLLDLGALAPLPASIAPPPKPAIATRPPDLIELAALAPLSTIAPTLAAVEFGASPKKPKDEPDTPPNGALALEGGWFSATMLSALQKYGASAQLTKATDVQPALSATY